MPPSHLPAVITWLTAQPRQLADFYHGSWLDFTTAVGRFLPRRLARFWHGSWHLRQSSQVQPDEAAPLRMSYVLSARRLRRHVTQRMRRTGVSHLSKSCVLDIPYGRHSAHHAYKKEPAWGGLQKEEGSVQFGKSPLEGGQEKSSPTRGRCHSGRASRLPWCRPLQVCPRRACAPDQRECQQARRNA